MLVEFQSTPYTSQLAEKPTPGCKVGINPEYAVSVYQLPKDKWERKVCTITTSSLDDGTSEYHIVLGTFEEVMAKLNDNA